MSTALKRPQLISLAAGFTDHASLPVAETRELLDALLRSPKTGRDALQYGTTIGDPLLRRLTTERLELLDSGGAATAPISPDRLLLTNGSQQLLYMATEALCDSGDIVMVEDPSYFVYLGILQSHGIQARGIRIDEGGLDLAHLERTLQQLQKSGLLPRLKLLYLVSYYQNPTGLTTGFERKAAALDLLRRFERAAGHPIFLLEDAAYRELRFHGPHVKSALAVPRRRDRVIYAGTYSKPFATGTRVGFGFLPPAVFTAVERIKGNHDFGSSNLLQQLLARALASGMYERHLGALRGRYAAKAKVMQKALEDHFPSAVRWLVPEGGLYFWVRLPKSVKSGPKSRLFREALKNDVLYVPGELCYALDPSRTQPACEMRLSFGAAPEASITEGIKRLGRAAHRFLG
jgi:2-aminoadipate transaminase